MVIGSHQNVFTTKLNDGVALSAANVKVLSLFEFPTGIFEIIHICNKLYYV